MTTLATWETDDTALVSVDGVVILQLEFLHSPFGWRTILVHDGRPVDGSGLSLTISGEEESDLRDDLIETARNLDSPGVTEAMRHAWRAKARIYRDDSRDMAQWGAYVRARAYARRESPQILSAAFEELDRMDRGACQGCDRPIDWHDSEPGYVCEYCGEEQRADPIKAVIEALHPNLPRL